MTKQRLLLICALLVSVITLSGAANVITFTTAKAVGETVTLTMTYTGGVPTLTGLNGTPQINRPITYTLTAQTVTIQGNVTSFGCGNNQITTLDVSQNTALIVLNCKSNQLTALDLSKNTALDCLDCESNQLNALDLSKNTKLTALRVYNNQLTELDLSKNTELAGFYGSNNKLTKLDLSKNTKLKRLDCSNNRLTALDVSKNTSLKALDCGGNRLTALDVSKNTKLEWLCCEHNQLTALYLPQTNSLQEIECYGNQIKGEEMTRLVNSLPDRTGKVAGTFVVRQEPNAEGNVCLKSDVAIADRKNWNTKKYNIGGKYYSDYEGEEPITYAVTLTKVGEGTLLISGASDLNAVPFGTELTIVATPAEGYELTALTANGEDILATGKVVVKEATEVKATFTKKTAAEEVEAGTLRLYPNPASTYVNVKGAKADALVRLYDAKGAMRYEARTTADGTLQIDLSAYAEGTYLLRVDGNAQRLLIQR